MGLKWLWNLSLSTTMLSKSFQQNFEDFADNLESHSMWLFHWGFFFPDNDLSTHKYILRSSMQAFLSSASLLDHPWDNPRGHCSCNTYYPWHDQFSNTVPHKVARVQVWTQWTGLWPWPDPWFRSWKGQGQRGSQIVWFKVQGYGIYSDPVRTCLTQFWTYNMLPFVANEY